jgi:fatty acid desaturase
MSLYLPFHSSILVAVVVVVVVVLVVLVVIVVVLVVLVLLVIVVVRVVEHLFKIHAIQNRKSKRLFSAKIFLQCLTHKNNVHN